MNLEQLLPHAIEWAQARAAETALSGRPLTERELEIARRVGVAAPEKVRIAIVDRMPFPEQPVLKEAASVMGMLGAATTGLTLDHSIFIRRGYETPRLIAHECRHVYQYEQAGSVAVFLQGYLQQLLTHGYFDSPYEKDARAHEA